MLLGALIGLLSGYALPTWLHYGAGNPKDQTAWLPMLRSLPGEAPFAVVVAPQLQLDFAGLSVVGAY